MTMLQNKAQATSYIANIADCVCDLTFGHRSNGSPNSDRSNWLSLNACDPLIHQWCHWCYK